MGKKDKIPTSPMTQNEKDDRSGPSSLPGWPGYRTREGRSGYDPIDTRTEAAHVSSAFIQKMFTGDLKIQHPVSLVLTGLFGLALLVPLILAVIETVNGNLLSWNGWIFFLAAGLAGLALLTNFLKNLLRRMK